MKLCTIHLFGLLTLIAISLILQGCMMMSHTIASADLLPQVQAGSPLKSVSPKTFAFKEFGDTRNISDPLLLMEAPFHKYKLDQPPAILVAEAIKKELERNGHICIDYSPQSKADFIIEGTVYKYWSFYTSIAWTYNSTANVAVKLTVSPFSGDKRVFIKNYEGEYVLNKATYSPKEVKEVLSQALMEMLKEISTDSELIEFIEK